MLFQAERDKTKGKNWFNMPAPELTEELENDLKVLQMRSALDPKHFYKRNSFKTLPKYFQVGFTNVLHFNCLMPAVSIFTIYFSNVIRFLFRLAQFNIQHWITSANEVNVRTKSVLWSMNYWLMPNSRNIINVNIRKLWKKDEKLVTTRQTRK